MGHRNEVRRGAERLGILLLAALLAAGAAAGAAAGPARGGNAGELLRVELERTDNLLERAREEVAGVRNAFAHDKLRLALDAQLRARRGFLEGTPGGLKRARTLTLEARSLALKAIEAAGLEKRARETVRTQLDRAQARATELAGPVRAAQDPLARQLYEQGLQQLRRAQRAFQGGRAQAARLAILAGNLIERAGRVARGTATKSAAVAASLERTAALLAEVELRRVEQGAPEAARESLEEARGALERAHDALRRGRLRAALRHSLRARELGLRLLHELRETPAIEDVQTALEDLEGLYAELMSGLPAEGRAAAASLLRRGRDQLAATRQLLAAGRPEAALSHLAAAEALLRDAAEAAGID